MNKIFAKIEKGFFEDDTNSSSVIHLINMDKKSEDNDTFDDTTYKPKIIPKSKNCNSYKKETSNININNNIFFKRNQHKKFTCQTNNTLKDWRSLWND